MTTLPSAVNLPPAPPLPREVRTLLRQAAVMRSWTAAWNWATYGIIGAAAGALVWAFLGMIVSLPLAPILVLEYGLLVALLCSLIRGLARARDLAPAARAADAHLQLRERLSTAVDLAAGRIRPTVLTDRVMRDAAAAARVSRGSLRPRLPAAARWALLALAAAVIAAVVIPGFTLPATPARDTASRIHREGRRLEQMARQLEQGARAQRAPQARRVAPEVRALGQGLQRQRLDRTQALARISALEKQLEQARRQVNQRITEALPPDAPPSLPESLFRPNSALDQSIRQLRELTSRLNQAQNVEGERENLLAQLAELSQAGEGQLPVQARRKLDEAEQRLQKGDVGGGRESLNDALQELEGLRALVADESALRMTGRELERSSMRIARGSGGQSGAEAERGETQTAPPGPGNRPLSPQEGESLGAAPPEGPHEGSQPGQGKVQEKLGAPTERLQTSDQRVRIRGQAGQGQLQTSELLGPGRSQPARLREALVSPTVVRRADEHMARARIPADLRAVVRRYFELLAGRR